MMARPISVIESSAHAQGATRNHSALLSREADDMKRSITQTLSAAFLTSVFTTMVTCAPATAQEQKPNIVIIWGDDIGQSNISAYSRGLMGYQTPNIDRLANEGVMFTDYYA